MKFSVTYSRKIQVRTYEMLEISLTAEFDDNEITYNQAKEKLKLHVDEWIRIEKARLLKEEK